MTFLLLCVALYGSARADSDQSPCIIDGGYLQQDRIFKDRTNIYDQKGHKAGYLEEDSVYKDRAKIHTD
jgi:hypothetical protein